MDRRRFLSMLAAGGAAMSTNSVLWPQSTQSSTAPASAAGKPSVIFVFADEWRAQAMGYEGDTNCSTPNFDAFARESVNFKNAVSGCSVCSPYRASLLTGQYPLKHGVYVNDAPIGDVHSIAHSFAENGYKTAYIGKWHVHGSPDGKQTGRKEFVPRKAQLGFEYWKAFECEHNYNKSGYFFNDDPTRREWEGYDAFAQARDAAEYIRSHASEPFLLMLSWGPPHFPLNSAPQEYRDKYANREIVLRPNVPEEFREKATSDLRGYYAHIEALDDAWAIIRDAIAESGLQDQAIVVFTSDHGEMRYCQGLFTKQYPWEESVRVPFLLKDPRRPQAAGTTHGAPIDAPDVMPTLLGLCDLPVPEGLQGRDWSPFIRGEQQLTGEECSLLNLAVSFAESRKKGIKPYRAIRTDRYMYARTTEGPWLLYDNQSDPYQMKNLINMPEHKELQDRLETQLQAKLKELDDEFLDEEVYIERGGYGHYGELSHPKGEGWKDPWAKMAGSSKPDSQPAVAS